MTLVEIEIIDTPMSDVSAGIATGIGFGLGIISIGLFFIS